MEKKHINGIYWYIKRIFDFLFSLILLIITFPLLLIVAISLFINLGRPICNQRRYREGLNKKKFLMYKLRTKKLDSDNIPRKKRYTKFSNFIDKTHLNELPQLINILKGDMSFIGPRPFIPGEELPECNISEKRYLVRPGLTGLAYVNGGKFLSHKKKLSYDEKYYDNFGFIQDFIILIKTPIAIIKQSKDTNKKRYK